MQLTAGRKLAVLGAVLVAFAVPACSDRQDDEGAVRPQTATAAVPGDISASPPVPATPEPETCPEDTVG